ncbi:MAG: beta-eliminating lyase-related protein [Pseudomonadota bacterium]
MIFTSDNASGAAPEVLAALTAANDGYTLPYGADPVSARVEARIREIFEAPEARVLLVATGTAANSLALAALCPPWGSAFCHRIAHVEEDECNAPVFFTGGAKLAHVEGPDARIDPAALAHAVAHAGAGVVHSAQPSAVSITQATERGAVYTVETIAEIGAIARGHGLGLHMDGTRFANALARTNATPAAMSWRAGVDILCLGATKCGALAAEAIILFEPERHPGKAWELELRRKRAGHLFSKMRFIAAQMEAWLAGDLWLRLAVHANTMCDRLAAGLGAAGVEIASPGEANLLYAHITLAQHRRLQAAGAVYYVTNPPVLPDGPDDARLEIRLVCSFATREADVDAFLAALSG